MTIPGLMQGFPLNVSQILRFAATAHGDREIVSKDCDGKLFRYDYAGALSRAAAGAATREILAEHCAALLGLVLERDGDLGGNEWVHGCIIPPNAER